jgi:Flp pilus assembly protein TadG
MSSEVRTMRRTDSARRGDRGQILILFVLAIFVIVGVVGIVLDGGAAYAQRRQEQSVADLAAMAGATAFLNTAGGYATKNAAADAAARVNATENGFTDGLNGTTLTVTIANSSTASRVKVDLTGVHTNNFAAVLGMPTWDVSVTATAMASDKPNGAIGAMPLLFNSEAFPGAVCDPDNSGCTPEVYQLPGTGNQDVPQDATQFNWTVFCANGSDNNVCEGNSSDVDAIINGGGNATTVYVNDDIGPLNSGTHNTLFTDLTDHIGESFPVPIVDDDGNMVGFGYFHLLSVEGNNDKVIRGYFVSPVNATALVVSPTGGDPSLLTGAYRIALVN